MLPVCTEYMGMASGAIAESQVTSTTPWVGVGTDQCFANRGRLHFSDPNIECQAVALTTSDGKDDQIEGLLPEPYITLYKMV